MAEKTVRDSMTVTLRGSVVFDPRPVGKGTKLRMCVSRGKKNRTTGGWDNTDTYIDVLVWHPSLAAYAANLPKYAKVFIEGAVLEENHFTDKEGNPRVTWQAVLPPFERDVEFDLDRQLGTFGEKEAPYQRQPARATVPFDANVSLADDIPF